MTNKSSKSPSGEDREQNNDYIREAGVQQEDITSHSGPAVPKMSPAKQENTDQRGYEEDQPQNPVRNTGEKKAQQDQPAGEPEKNGD